MLLIASNADAAGHRAVADDADDLPLAAELLVGDRDAQRGAGAGADVAEVEGVGLALGLPAEAAHAAELPQRRELLLAAGEDLVGIGLVAAVPDDHVLGDVEGVVQGQGQLDHAQVRPRWPPVF